LICACSITTIFGAHALADTAGGHVVVIVLENEGFDSTFGPASPAPYLATELARQWSKSSRSFVMIVNLALR
jgi:hypothetical protein